ncbi:MAG: hypothetical protein IPJ98_00280 [Bryobacterales bacterium]|nr:hypothetical protein [Bryobacterales bacterium]
MFTRIASQDKHGEAITTRPLFLHGIARHTRHAQQNHLSLSSLHAKARQIANLLSKVSGWLRAFRASAEQLAGEARWPALLRSIFHHFLAASPPSTPSKSVMAASNCRI